MIFCEVDFSLLYFSTFARSQCDHFWNFENFVFDNFDIKGFPHGKNWKFKRKFFCNRSYFFYLNMSCAYSQLCLSYIMFPLKKISNYWYFCKKMINVISWPPMTKIFIWWDYFLNNALQIVCLWKRLVDGWFSKPPPV